MGSEPGMGWNWIINLAKYCEVYVISEGEYRKQCEDGNVFERCAGIRVIGAFIVIMNVGNERLQILQEIYVERIKLISYTNSI